MKKFLGFTVLFACALSAAAAQSAFDGSWTMEVIGAEDTFRVEIRGSAWTFFKGTDSISDTVTVDESKGIIVIPLFFELSDYFRYVDDEGRIDLYVGEKFNISLLDYLVESLSSLRDFNGVSADAVDILVPRLEAIFLEIPVIRLSRAQ